MFKRIFFLEKPHMHDIINITANQTLEEAPSTIQLLRWAPNKTPASRYSPYAIDISSTPATNVSQNQELKSWPIILIN